MSPLLYNIYVDDLNVRLNNANAGCELKGTKFNCLCYADDMVLLAPSCSGLQRLVDICENFAEVHDVIYNTKKSVCMLFCPSVRKLTGLPVTRLNSSPLNYCDNVTYLGHIITNTLNDELDIKRQYRSLCIRGNSLSRKFTNCSDKVKCLLFKSYCVNMYCPSLWVNFTLSSLNSLRVRYVITMHCA